MNLEQIIASLNATRNDLMRLITEFLPKIIGRVTGVEERIATVEAMIRQVSVQANETEVASKTADQHLVNMIGALTERVDGLEKSNKNLMNMCQEILDRGLDTATPSPATSTQSGKGRQRRSKEAHAMVMAMINAGHTHKDISTQTGIPLSTVKSYSTMDAETVAALPSIPMESEAGKASPELSPEVVDAEFTEANTLLEQADKTLNGDTYVPEQLPQANPPKQLKPAPPCEQANMLAAVWYDAEVYAPPVDGRIVAETWDDRVTPPLPAHTMNFARGIGADTIRRWRYMTTYEANQFMTQQLPGSTPMTDPNPATGMPDCVLSTESLLKDVPF